nr:AAA family ATPase [Rhizobium sp. BK456]
MFSGRTAELDAMESAFRDVSGGRQHSILLGAEAGGGKSRLVEEVVDRLSSMMPKSVSGFRTTSCSKSLM